MTNIYIVSRDPLKVSLPATPPCRGHNGSARLLKMFHTGIARWITNILYVIAVNYGCKEDVNASSQHPLSVCGIPAHIIYFDMGKISSSPPYSLPFLEKLYSEL